MKAFDIRRSLACAALALWLPSPVQAAPDFAEKPLADGECAQAVDLDWTALEMGFDPDQGLIDGEFQTVVQNLSHQPVAQICFALNPGLKIRKLALKGLDSAAKTPPEGASPLVYRLKLKPPLAPHLTQQLKLSYSGPIQSAPKFGRIRPDDVFLTAQTGFYPRFERASQRRCPMELLLHVPKDYRAVASGSMAEQKNGEIHTALESICGTQNDFGFDLSAARYAYTVIPPVRIFHRGRADAKQLQEMGFRFKSLLQALEKQFGTHSFARFNLVETHREDLGGMAKTNTVFLSDKYFGPPDKVAPAQFAYFKQLLGDAAQAGAEFGFYQRSVMAHEMAHLFVNYFYDYDQPWAAEGLPEFAGLTALASLGQRADAERKLKAYRQVWEQTRQQMPQQSLPPLNQARLDDPLGYLVNYQGTPLLLYSLSQSHGESFWKTWRGWLADRQHPLLYQNLKSWLKLTPAEAAQFETAFDPAKL